MLQGTPQDPSGEAATVDALVDLASRQADLLPDGGTDPYFFPSRTAAVATAVGVTTAVCLLIAGTGWVAVLRSRRRRRDVARLVAGSSSTSRRPPPAGAGEASC